MPNNNLSPEEFAKLVKKFVDEHPEAVKSFLNSPNVQEILLDDLNTLDTSD